jgi:hypothetical protein
MPSVPVQTDPKQPEVGTIMENESPRKKLMREAVVLQLKLLADGLRDAVLIPVSLIAAIIGLARGGDDADREYRKVIKLGRRSERWINLFGHQRPLGRSHPVGSLDNVLHQAEVVVVEQYKKGRPAEDNSSEENDNEAS